MMADLTVHCNRTDEDYVLAPRGWLSEGLTTTAIAAVNTDNNSIVVVGYVNNGAGASCDQRRKILYCGILRRPQK